MSFLRIIKYSIALSLLLFSVGTSRSQESRTEVRFEFRANSMSIDSLYGDNAARMREMTSFLRDIRRDSTIDITGVSFCGAASPEGSSTLNRKLAQGRLSALEMLVRSEIDLPDSIVTREDSYIPWEYLKSQVEDSDIRCKEEVTAILDMKPEYVEYRPGTKIDRRVLELQKLDNGRVWQQMNDLFFSRMRNACAVFVTYKQAVPSEQPEEAVPDTVTVESKPVVETVTDTIAESEGVETFPTEPEGWQRRFYVKTNAIGWAMGVTNIAAEIDLAEHWSFTLPLYWSSWNYFKSTLKFRTLTLQPEVRYWFSGNNAKWFAGAHFGLGWYNFATNGSYRTQDHGGHSPAIGGGIATGYRLPLSHNKQWKIEFSLGVGVYSAHYDKFRNEPNGLLVETKKETWFGIDQAAVTVTYTFDLGKKGGSR